MSGTVSPKTGARPKIATDFLKLESAVAAWFWLSPWVLGIGKVGDQVGERFPWLALLWFATWISSPLVALLGLVFVGRDHSLPYAWPQVLLGTLLLASVWFGAARIEH